MVNNNSSGGIVISAGLAIIKEKKILLLKPKGVSSTGHFSIPKGIVEKGESYRDAAIRETFEEVGLKIPIKDLSKEEKVVKYINKGIITKKVYYYVVKIKNNGTIPDILPKDWLQKEEVIHAEFYSKREAFDLIFWRFRHILFELDIM